MYRCKVFMDGTPYRKDRWLEFDEKSTSRIDLRIWYLHACTKTGKPEIDERDLDSFKVVGRGHTFEGKIEEV